GCRASGGRGRLPSCDHNPRVGDVLVKWDLRQQLERLDVARTSPGDEVTRQLRAWSRLVPPDALAPIAHVLLVERGLWAARLIPLRRPEARRVGRQRLIAKDDGALRVDPELELRIRDNDPPRGGVLLREAVQLERRVTRGCVPLLAAQTRGLLLVDV